MKIFKRLKLQTVLMIVAVMVTLVLTTYITFNLNKRNDAADKAIKQNISYGNPEGSGLFLNEHAGTDKEVNSIIIAGENNELAENQQEPVDIKIEKDTTEINQLTENQDNTPTIATSGDADADKSESEAGIKDETEAGTKEPGDVQEDASAETVSNGKRVYLTFDDGPSGYTNELLDILAQYDVKATFFVVNNYEHEAELKRIAEEGHTIGLHSGCHIYSKLYADMDSYKNDVEMVHTWVKRVTGIDTKYYRFPGGSSNTVSEVPISMCVEYLHDNGYEYYDWNAQSGDAENSELTPEELNENVMTFVRNNPGASIVLMHDLDEHYNTIEALPALIETLKSEGYQLCVIDEDAPVVQHYESN